MPYKWLFICTFYYLGIFRFGNIVYKWAVKLLFIGLAAGLQTFNIDFISTFSASIALGISFMIAGLSADLLLIHLNRNSQDKEI